MKELRKNVKGFTLLELLIVIVILGVLAGLAIPMYQAQIERSRGQEARNALMATRESALRFFSTNGAYTAMTLPTTVASEGVAGVLNGACNAATCLDFDPNSGYDGTAGYVGTGGQRMHFYYTVSGVAANTFTINAIRNNSENFTAGVLDKCTIIELGTVNCTGVFA